MAKFRKMKRYARRAFKSAKRYARSEKLGVVETAVGSAAYGAVRPYLANAVPNVSALGQYSDHVIIGGVAALAAAKGKGIVKRAGMIVLANEAFLAGSQAASKMTSTPASNTSGWQ